MILLLVALTGLTAAGPRFPGVSKGARKGPVNMQLVMAQAKLQQGRPRMAADAAATCLASNPELVGCKAVLARARAEFGMCDEAMPLFDELRPLKIWNAELAISESLCHIRSGDLARAEVALEEATGLAVRSPFAWYHLTMVRIWMGAFDGARDALESLEGLKDSDGMIDIASTWLSVETGDPGVDGDLWVVTTRYADRHRLNPLMQAKLAECHRWLDVGDPVAAAGSAADALALSMGHNRSLACKAEATRRVGMALEAVYMLDRPWLRGLPAPSLDAIRVRALLDLGRLEEAEEVLGRLPASLDPEIVATRWYSAARLGHAADQARFEWWYDTANQSSGRGLSQLIPMTETP